MIVSGGLATAEDARARLRGVGRRRGDDRPRRARQPVDLRGADRPPGGAAERRRDRARAALDDGARRASTWRPERAARYLRKFYPWYLERLGIRGAEATPSSGRRASTRRARWSRASDHPRSSPPQAAQSRGNRLAIIAAPARPRERRSGAAFGRLFRRNGRRRDAARVDKQGTRFQTVARESLITQEGLEKLREELELSDHRQAP